MMGTDEDTLDMTDNTVLDALERAEEFITNGIEYGHIEMPGDICDAAHETLPAIKNAIPIYKAEREEWKLDAAHADKVIDDLLCENKRLRGELDYIREKSSDSYRYIEDERERCLMLIHRTADDALQEDK